ncbi:hypothetical protein ACFWTC_38560 [Streptomyces sp. NPDC058619]|uniref:hypothetical protein n=1 Tax=unclassified Streptomyces TaxID=2593676 RepID=UPI00365FEBE3
MVRSVREQYDENQAAGRLRVPLAAWRWVAGSGLVPAADAGPGLWSRAVVEAADPEQVRAALRGPIGAGVAADRLTEALGAPLRCRPRVTASAVGHLGGQPLGPPRRGCRVPRRPPGPGALTRRRDLPALLDRHVPLGPDQAARRLGVRRVDFDQVVRLGWVAPAGSVEIDYKHHGGVTVVPLYCAEDVALLPVVRPLADWRAVYAAPAGCRSPLAALTPVVPGRDRVLLGEVGRIARVGRAAVMNWRRRHADFPGPAGGTEVHPQFDRPAVVAWLLAHDKIGVPVGMPSASLVVAGAGRRTSRFRLDDPWLVLADDAEGEDQLSGWSTDADADALAALGAGEFRASVRRLTAPGTGPLAVLGEVRVIERFRSGSGGLRVTLAWPTALRGTAESTADGVVRHGVPSARSGEGCVCRRYDCGGVVPVSWCAEHGDAVGPVMEWHPGGGIRCTKLAQGSASSAVLEGTARCPLFVGCAGTRSWC